MKTFLLLILLISNSLYAQTTFNETSESQLDYYKSHYNDLKDESGSSVFSSLWLDSLNINGQDSFGWSVSSAGDVNGDGYSDVIVAANQYNNSTGRAYLFYGGASMDSIADVTMTGESNGDSFGWSVSTAGDVNGDGYSDIIVGARSYNTGFGRAYIFYGGASMNNIADVILNGEGPGLFGESVSIAGDVNTDGYSDVIVSSVGYTLMGKVYVFYGGTAMDNIPDVTMTGNVFSGGFGNSVSSAGDVNGDGYSDVIVGAHYQGDGKAFVFYGGAPMNNVADVILTGVVNNFGQIVSTAGDVNGDGYSDVIVTTGRYHADEGRVYIFYGGSPMNNVEDVTMTGAGLNTYFGMSVSTAGDINRDGYSDVIVGAFRYESTSNVGSAYIFYGGSLMNNVPDVIIKGESGGDGFGFSVSKAGDVNGDGYSDVIVGAYAYNNYNGRVYVYFGKPSIRIKVKAIMEGMYYPVFNQMTRTDSVKIYLRSVTIPYSIIDSAKGKIDSLSFLGLFNFINAPSGTYFLVVKHFNCIETWSKVGGESLVPDSSVFNYDFTTSSSKAYGNNLKLKGSKYCIYSGDPDQSDFIDVEDIILIYNEASALSSGRFLPADLNGDNFVDSDDLIVCYNNMKNLIGVIRP